MSEEKETKEEEEKRSPTALQVFVKVILASLPRLARYFYHVGIDSTLRSRKLLRIFAMIPTRSIILKVLSNGEPW